MRLEIRDLSVNDLATYASVPSTVAVTHRVVPSGGDWPWPVEPVATPYTKDYDVAPALAPETWPAHFDLTRWRLFGAYALEGGTWELVGAAAVAPAPELLEPGALPWPLEELTVLWDLRVHPRHQHHGVGRALFDAAARCAADAGSVALVIETQDDNPTACAFYAAMGCELASYVPNAYGHSDEARLLWCLRLAPHVD